MNERDIEKRLRGAIERTAPDGSARLLSEVTGRKGAVKMTKRRNRWLGLVAAVLALALIGGAGGLYYRQNYAVATVVSLDVNPSIELQVNRAEKVIACSGLNAEGREILSSMNGGEDLKGSRLNVAVNAIVGAIVRAGYLDSLSSAILISVEDNDQARGERLQAQLVAEVDGVLKAAANSAGVLSQNMTADRDLDRQAQENNISSGKAALINQVIALNSALDFAALSKLSVEELRDLIAIGAPAMPIGRDEALRRAREAAGLADAASLRYEVDPELDDPTPRYEVELESAGAEYDYSIHAFTGEVLASAANIPDIPQYQNPNTDRLLTAQEAFNAAAERFHADYPELAGYNIFDIDTEYRAANNTYEVDFDVAGNDFEYIIDAATGEVVGGHTDYRAPQPDTREPTPSAPDTPPTQPVQPVQPDTPADIGEAAAKAAALQKAGIADADSVTWIKCQRDWEDGCYDLEFECGSTVYECEVRCADGAVTDYSSEPCDDLSHHHGDGQRDGGDQASSGDIGPDAAAQAALTHAGLTAADVRGLAVERDWEGGRLVYEVEFRSGVMEYEYKIDAATASVLEHEAEIDD